MNLLRLLSTAFAFFFIIVQSQAQEVKWIKETWGSGSHGDIDVDSLGSIYITGSFNSNANSFHNEDLPITHNSNAFIAKFDNEGQLIWTEVPILSDKSTMPSPLQIASDRFGNTYTLGSFTDSIQFGELLLTNGSDPDIFLVKHNINGEALWAKHIGSNRSDYSSFISTDNLGSVYISARIKGTLFLGDSAFYPSSKYYEDNIIVKYDANGNLQWVHQGIGNGQSSPRLFATQQGELIFSGNYQHFVQWGEDSLHTQGNVDQFVGKIDRLGKLAWIKTIHSDERVTIYNHKIDVDDNIYLIGKFGNNPVFNDTAVNRIEEPTFKSFDVVKLNPQGQLLWLSTYMSDTTHFRLFNIITDNEGKVFSYAEETEIIDRTNFSDFKSYGLVQTQFNATTGAIEEIRRYEGIPGLTNMDIDGLGNIYSYNSFFNEISFEDDVIYSTQGPQGSYLARIGHFEEEEEEVLLTTGNTSIYPNPLNDVLNLEMSEDIQLPVSCSVYDFQGRLVIEQEVQDSQSTVEFSHLQQGIYMLVLFHEDSTVFTEKVVKY